MSIDSDDTKTIIAVLVSSTVLDFLEQGIRMGAKTPVVIVRNHVAAIVGSIGIKCISYMASNHGSLQASQIQLDHNEPEPRILFNKGLQLHHSDPIREPQFLMQVLYLFNTPFGDRIEFHRRVCSATIV